MSRRPTQHPRYTLMRQSKLPERSHFQSYVELILTQERLRQLGEAYMTNGDKELAIANYKNLWN